ncbi:MAG TPA: phospho-sugar mutase [Halanaerobiales bacterium]|nr:phospho-sugar mutase [Halanaerobiales bacterium]
MDFMQRYKKWLKDDYFDEETKKELEAIKDNEKEIEDRFYKDLEFGTGGMRSKIGAGTNRINKYTIRRATQGFANYIINYYEDEGKNAGAVIAYDPRHKSAEFALETALVLAANNIKTYLFDSLRPTPELSFAVRELNACGGIVITASHNPPEYNGYKVYGPNGCQLVPDLARKVIAEINEIDNYSMVKTISKEKAIDKDLLEYIGEDIDSKYIEAMIDTLPKTELVKEKGQDLNIIYTPLHGSAYKLTERLLKELGFDNLSIVEKQAVFDPDFSTVESPNPEEYSAFEMALDMAENQDADLIMGTDPDGDRMGAIVKDEKDEYIGLNGNQIGILMADFLLNNTEVPANGVIIKTIVTTELIRKLAADHGIEVMDTLTGFKYIGELMTAFEEKGNKEFILGFEESYGYLVGDYARDKDAIVATGLTAILALFYKEQGKTLYQRLQEIYEQYGYYKEDLIAIRREGKEGQEKINGTIKNLREKGVKEIADRAVVLWRDYKEGKEFDLKEDKTNEIDLPESNVLQYLLEDESLITVRPSGTEPKLKVYFAVNDKTAQAAQQKLEEIRGKFSNRVEEIIENI